MPLLHGARTSQKPNRKHHDAAHQPQHAVNRNADDAERNENDPDDRVQDQGEDGERPAQDQQDAPEEKLSHVMKYDSGRNWFQRK